ncbi:UDP-glucuronosyltransferase 1-9-like protein [Cricetulus griseus]|nr:UDP-glucuronosyltransferase 1-9-like protein [Cricetulus griseus]
MIILEFTGNALCHKKNTRNNRADDAIQALVQAPRAIMGALILARLSRYMNLSGVMITFPGSQFLAKLLDPEEISSLLLLLDPRKLKYLGSQATFVVTPITRFLLERMILASSLLRGYMDHEVHCPVAIAKFLVTPVTELDEVVIEGNANPSIQGAPELSTFTSYLGCIMSGRDCFSV